MIKETRTKIEQALTSLKNLLSDPLNSEDKYQEWFETHQIVFFSLGIKENIPHPKLVDYKQKELFPDFMVKLLNGTWEIFELKLPFAKILKDKEKRNTFYAKTYEYIQQCIDYSEFFNDNSNRENFKELYGFSVDVPPRSKLLIGRDEGIDRYELIRLLDNHSKYIDILTYDDILRHLEFLQLNTLGQYQNLPGLTIHFIANIHKSKTDNYILHLGNESDKNNISVFVNQNDDLCFKIIDCNGVIHMSVVENSESIFELDKISYFVFEIGLADTYSVISIEVNGKYGSVNQINKLTFDLNNLVENTVIGSNATGEANSDFDMIEHIIWPYTLNLDSRVSLRNNVFENFFQLEKMPQYYISFFDNRFFYSNSHASFTKDDSYNLSDLVQPVNNKQPGIIGPKMPKGEFFIPVFCNQSK